MDHGHLVETSESQEFIQPKNVGNSGMSVGQGEVGLHQVRTFAEMCQCRLGNIDGQTVKFIAFDQLLEAYRRPWPAPVNFDISNVLDKHGIVVEVVFELAAATETDRLLAKEDTEELVA